MCSSRSVYAVPVVDRRLTGEERRRRLVAVARRIVARDGADALTLARVAVEDGVSKPVVYGHFPTRAALLLALYDDFNARQTGALTEALAAAGPSLPARTAAISRAFVSCHLLEGAEVPGVVDALTGDPGLEARRRAAEETYLQACREALASATGGGELSPAAAVAFLGAAENLSRAALHGTIGSPEAEQTLAAVLRTVLTAGTTRAPRSRS